MTTELDSNLHRDVGRLDGRLGALETRMDRHEIETRAQLTNMDGKLDQIQTTLAGRGGVSQGGATVLHWLLSIVALAISAVGGLHMWKAP